jgi:hypothetical protein
MTVLRPGALLAALLFLGFWMAEAMAGGPVETNIFAVQGVPADVTSTDASAAKNQALMDVQVKAFFILIERLGSVEIAQDLNNLKPDEIAAYLKSLSIEQEYSSPGRYVGTFTVRFLPAKIQRLLESYGVRVPTRQASPIIVLPVYREPSGSKLWEDNLWRKAWLDLRAEQSMVPIIVPIGDLEDTETLTEEDVLNGDPIKLEAIRKRYGASSLVVAVAEPAEGGAIHAMMSGNTTLGKVTFDKTYTSENANPEQSAALATRRFHAIMMEKYKEHEARAAANPGAPLSIAVAVPFGSPTEWNGIRSRILSTPNVIGVDVSTLSAEGAVIRLTYRDDLPVLQNNMQRTGLALSQIGQSWVIQPM